MRGQDVTFFERLRQEDRRRVKKDLVDRIFRALEAHRSVKTVAQLFGMEPRKLSRLLNSGSRRGRWRKLKAEITRECASQRRARTRARYRERYVRERVDAMLMEGKPVEALNPNQIRLLVEAGLMSQAEAAQLAQRRDFWHLKDPMRGLYYEPPEPSESPDPLYYEPSSPED